MKTKAQINYAVTKKLICAFLFSHMQNVGFLMMPLDDTCKTPISNLTNKQITLNCKTSQFNFDNEAIKIITLKFVN